MDNSTEDDQSCQDDLEMKALSQSWTSCKTFFKQIQNRQATVMSEKVKELINNIKTELIEEATALTGAIPKRIGRERVKKEEMKDDEESEDDDKEDASKWLRTLARKLDNRTVPKLEKYQEESGLELAQYIARFEEYYQDNYKGQKYHWIGELEDRLTGQALIGLRTIRQVDDTYEMTKNKLLQWYEEKKVKSDPDS